MPRTTTWDGDVCAAIRAAYRSIDPRKAINFAGMATHVTTGYGNRDREPTVRPTGSEGMRIHREERDVLRDARVLRVLYQEFDETTRLLTIGHCHGIGQKRILSWLRLGPQDERDDHGQLVLRPDGKPKRKPGVLNNNDVRSLVDGAHRRVAQVLDGWTP